MAVANGAERRAERQRSASRSGCVPPLVRCGSSRAVGVRRAAVSIELFCEIDTAVFWYSRKNPRRHYYAGYCLRLKIITAKIKSYQTFPAAMRSQNKGAMIMIQVRSLARTDVRKYAYFCPSQIATIGVASLIIAITSRLVRFANKPLRLSTDNHDPVTDKGGG